MGIIKTTRTETVTTLGGEAPICPQSYRHERVLGELACPDQTELCQGSAEGCDGPTLLHRTVLGMPWVPGLICGISEEAVAVAATNENASQSLYKQTNFLYTISGNLCEHTCSCEQFIQ